jgi:FtsP/CotA-like multicopper oxidase with cupredoxin domain
MQRGQRIGLIVAAVVVAVVAFLVLSGGDDDEDSATTQAETVETQPATTGEPTATVPGPKPEPSVNTIRVVGGQPEGGVQDITVNKDDTVRIDVKSPDTSAEVHLHGYDVSKDLEAGGSVSFRIKADIEGVFEVELEETKTPIAELSVEP